MLKKNALAAQYFPWPSTSTIPKSAIKTERGLFIFHSTKDPEIYCTWGLGSHSTLCQSIFSSEEKATQKRQRLLFRMYWMTNNNLDWSAEKYVTDQARISEQWYVQNNISKCISESQWKQLIIQDYLNHPWKVKKQKAIKQTHSTQQEDSAVHLHLGRMDIKRLWIQGWCST